MMSVSKRFFTIWLYIGLRFFYHSRADSLVSLILRQLVQLRHIFHEARSVQHCWLLRKSLIVSCHLQGAKVAQLVDLSQVHLSSYVTSALAGIRLVLAWTFRLSFWCTQIHIPENTACIAMRYWRRTCWGGYLYFLRPLGLVLFSFRIGCEVYPELLYYLLSFLFDLLCEQVRVVPHAGFVNAAFPVLVHIFLWAASGTFKVKVLLVWRLKDLQIGESCHFESVLHPQLFLVSRSGDIIWASYFRSTRFRNARLSKFISAVLFNVPPPLPVLLCLSTWTLS